jgi:hypothetical protein
VRRGRRCIEANCRRRYLAATDIPVTGPRERGSGVSLTRRAVQKESLTVSQREMLLGLPSRIPVERIDRLWLFQPQHGRAGESGLAVLSLLPEEPLFS